MCFVMREELNGELNDVFRGTLEECAARWGLALHAYCLMPDHVHVVVSVQPRTGDFERFTRRLKCETSRRIHLRGFPTFGWQRSFWDRNARKEDDVRARIEYTLGNPVRKGLCRFPNDWLWSKYYGWPRTPTEGPSERRLRREAGPG
jgi:REP element-mobilizing transposase RayT